MQSRWKPGVTVAAVIEKDGRFLLVEEQRPEGLMLNNPAGHLEPGESPEHGVVREVLEESAYRFTPTALVGIYLSSAQKTGSGEVATFLRFTYTGTVGEVEVGRALDVGVVRALWMTLDEVKASSARHRSPSVLRSIEDYLAGRRYPLELVYTDPEHLRLTT